MAWHQPLKHKAEYPNSSTLSPHTTHHTAHRVQLQLKATTSTLLPPVGADQVQQKVNLKPADALTAFILAKPPSRTPAPRSPPPSYQSFVPLYPQADLVPPAVTSRPVPLTAKNLQKLNEEDMAHPVTTALSTKSKSSGPGPLDSQKSTKLQAVRLVMQANRIPIEDEEAIEYHPHLLDYAKEFIIQTRDLPMTFGMVAKCNEKKQ